MVRRVEVIRTCVGCRIRTSATELLRVVAVPDSHHTVFRLIPDSTRRRAGRGAHIHPVPECLDKALRRRAFGRALRLASAPDATAVETHVADNADR